MLTPMRLVFLSCLAASLAGGARPGAAQVLVLSSEVKGLEIGKELAESERLIIPARQSVRILLPSGATALLRGPADRPVRELAAGQSRLDALWQRVKDYFEGGDSKENAAGRGPTADLLDWKTIPIPAPAKGAICVLSDIQPVFVRDEQAKKEAGQIGENGMKFAFGDALPNRPLMVRWEKGGDRADWPKGVLPLDGGRYFAVPDFAPAGVIELRFVDKASVEGDEALKTLWGSKCYMQADAWLRRNAPLSRK
jgi:hypothetical protein